MTPEELLEFLQRTVDEGFVSQIYSAASVGEAEVLETLREADLDVYSLTEIHRLPTEALDAVADAHLKVARRVGAVAGVTYGAFGILTAIPEIVHLMVAVLRTAQRMSLTYGHEIQSFQGNLQLWEAVAKSFGIDPESYEGTEPQGLGTLPVPKFNSDQMKWNPIIFGVARKVLITIGYIFLKKRWARAVPLIGIGLSGVGNYTLLKRFGRELKEEFRGKHQMLGLRDDSNSIPIDFTVA